MILLIDNYDSFTYNLYQVLSELNADVKVVRNDKITLEEIENLNPQGIVLSPGPGRPEIAGICMDVIRTFGSKVPILGVCLGHQAIGLVFGGEVNRAGEILHGKDSLIFHRRNNLFKGMPLPFKAGRYHSLIVEKLPSELVVDAETADGVVMGMHHQKFPIYGVQFHPESILTPEGKTVIRNFLEICNRTQNDSGFRPLPPIECLHLLIERKSLTAEECSQAVLEMLQEPIQMGAFLALLSAKGETADEILGLVKAMRSQMRALELDRPVLDIVGTGGDRAGTVNISTGAALLAALCGIPVVKHGNRAVSSQCGSADVLEAMGHNIHMTPEEVKESVQKTGFGFCFAPDYHPMMKQVRPVRNALKIPTAFNLIGPLLSPAGTDYLQIGVYKPELVKTMAEVLFKLGTKRSLVYCGHGMDELSCIGPTEAILVTEKGLEPLLIDPEQLGLSKCSLEDLKGSDAKSNAQMLQNPPRAVRETLILNAGVALFLYGPARSIEEGVQIAKRKCRKSLKEAIRQNRGAVIAEIKRASPSKGKIGEIPNAASRALLYEESGATAISVLTSERFEGSLNDLRAVTGAVSIPVLRKDFLITKEQLAETDADAVLLIVAFLGERTKEMLIEAHQLGLEAIVEIHNAAELGIALDAGAEIIGVNQRNLKDFSMHPAVYELVKQIPERIAKIAESGVHDLADAHRLFEMGYDAILVGEALTRNPQLCEELCSLKSVV